MDEIEIYTFADFCEDRGILSHKSTDDLRHLKAMWSVYGDEYLAYCKSNRFEWERL